MDYDLDGTREVLRDDGGQYTGVDGDRRAVKWVASAQKSCCHALFSTKINASEAEEQVGRKQMTETDVYSCDWDDVAPEHRDAYRRCHTVAPWHVSTGTPWATDRALLAALLLE